MTSLTHTPICAPEISGMRLSIVDSAAAGRADLAPAAPATLTQLVLEKEH